MKILTLCLLAASLIASQADKTAFINRVQLYESKQSPNFEFSQTAFQQAVFGRHLAVLAKERSRNAELVKYAATLEYDYSEINAIISALLQFKDSDLSHTISAEQNLILEKLADVNAKDFDQVFLNVLHGQQEVGMYLYEKHLQIESESMRNFIRETLPVLRNHLRSTYLLQQLGEIL